MAYEFELDEYNRTVRSMTEMERAATEVDVRQSRGLCGDAEDARYDDAPHGEGEE